MKIRSLLIILFILWILQLILFISDVLHHVDPLTGEPWH